MLPHTRVLLLLNSTRWMERVWSFMCTCRDKAGGLACTHMDVKLKRCTTGVCQLHIMFQTVTVNTTHNYHYYSYNHFSCSALTCRSGWWNLTSSARSTIFYAAWGANWLKLEKAVFVAHGWWLTVYMYSSKLHTCVFQVFWQVCVHCVLLAICFMTLMKATSQNVMF